MNAGFFRGTNVDQDGRFSDKEKKMMKTLIFEPILDQKIDMKKVNLDTIKPWISERICEILGFEDEVVIQFVYELLQSEEIPNPQRMQMQLAGFLQAYNSRIFMKDLWVLLSSAQSNISGIPEEFIKKKKDEIKKSRGNQENVIITQAEIEAITEQVSKMVEKPESIKTESEILEQKKDKKESVTKEKAETVTEKSSPSLPHKNSSQKSKKETSDRKRHSTDSREKARKRRSHRRRRSSSTDSEERYKRRKRRERREKDRSKSRKYSRSPEKRKSKNGDDEEKLRLLAIESMKKSKRR